MTATTTRIFTDKERAMLDRVRDTVRAIEPDATVILYGSRARGDYAPDSDWDLLVLLDGDVSQKREQAVRDRVHDLEYDANTMFSPVVRGKDVWETRLHRAMPFHQNVEYDGVILAPEMPSFGLSQAMQRVSSGEGDADLSAEREELVQLELARARRTLTEADVMATIGSWNTCVNRLYYACF